MKTRAFLCLAGVVSLVLWVQPGPSHAACSDPLGCVTVGPGDPIHIAYALATEGPNAFLGIDARNGVEIALDDAGGQILGHDVLFDGVNSSCTYEGGLAAGQALAADATIVAVIGTSCSVEARAAAPLLSAAGLVMVSPSNTSPTLTEPGHPDHYPGYLRTAPNDKVQGAESARFVYHELGLTQAATLRDGTSYADSLRQAFAQAFTALGGEITAQEEVDPDQTDLSGVLGIVAAGSPDLVYLPVFMPAGGRIIVQARDTAGLESATLMGSDGLYAPDVPNATGEDVEGFLVSSPDLMQNSAEYFEFVLPAYRARFGDPVGPFHAHAYDAFMLVRAAIQRAAIRHADGTLEIGRQALRDAMYGTRKYPGLTGDLTCSASGDCADPHIGMFRYHTGQFPPEHIWPDTTGIATPEDGGTVTSPDGDTIIQVPAGAITDTVVLTVRLAHQMPLGAGLVRVGQAFEVTAVYSDTGRPAQIAPGHSYTMTVHYTDAEKGAAIEDTLALYYAEGGQAVQEPTSHVDPAGQSVTATPGHFSRWAVLGETNRVYLPLVVRN